MDDGFYRALEERFRGPRDLIRQRLEVYLPFVTPLLRHYPALGALDLGCGRGEWLELLGSLGFSAEGVDLDQGMLAACGERGLRAEAADALAAIRSRPDGSLAVVSAFHVIEHLPFADVRLLIGEALRVLAPGGLLLLETPNPENLEVGAHRFYTDPTHRQPVPPVLLSFAVEFAGFERVKILRLQESGALRQHDAEVGLAEVLGGVSPDYAVVARKRGSPDTLALAEHAFDADHGLTLESLTSRFTSGLQRLATRLKDVEGALKEADAANRQLKALAADRALQIQNLRGSLSWRCTAPLRWLASPLPWQRARGLPGRALAAVLRHLALVLQARPRLRDAAAQCLRRLPRVEAALYRAAFGKAPVRPHASGIGNDAPIDAAFLSPHATHFLERLERRGVSEPKQA